MSTVLISADEFTRYCELDESMKNIHKLAVAKWSDNSDPESLCPWCKKTHDAPEFIDMSDGWLKVMQLSDPAVRKQPDEGAIASAVAQGQRERKPV